MIRRERSGASRKNNNAGLLPPKLSSQAGRLAVRLCVCLCLSAGLQSDKRAAIKFQPGCQLQKGARIEPTEQKTRRHRRRCFLRCQPGRACAHPTATQPASQTANHTHTTGVKISITLSLAHSPSFSHSLPLFLTLSLSTESAGC